VAEELHLFHLLLTKKRLAMQKTNQPTQETDKNKGDQSAVEQQKKETMKNPSPENMGGAQNAQQADDQVTNKSQQSNNNDGTRMNPTNTGSESMTAQDHDRMEERSKGMTGQGAGSQSNPGMSGSQSNPGITGQGGREQQPVNQTNKGQRQYGAANDQESDENQDDTGQGREQGNTMGAGQQQKGGAGSSGQGPSKNQGR
jgi:hypothetical protein